MVDEGHQVAPRRDPRAADPARGLVQHVPDGQLQAMPAFGVAHHRQLLAVGGPIRLVDVVEHLAGRTAFQGDARQGAVTAAPEELAAQGDRHLARGGDREYPGGGEAEGSRLRALRPGGEDLDR